MTDCRKATLKVGTNCWRIERANRARVLIDAAAYYGALRQTPFRHPYDAQNLPGAPAAASARPYLVPAGHGDGAQLG